MNNFPAPSRTNPLLCIVMYGALFRSGGGGRGDLTSSGVICESKSARGAVQIFHR